MKDPGRGPSCLSTTRSRALWGCGWVWNVVGGGSSWGGLAHCWALRNQLAGCLWPPSALSACDAWVVVVGGFVV